MMGDRCRLCLKYFIWYLVKLKGLVELEEIKYALIALLLILFHRSMNLKVFDNDICYTSIKNNNIKLSSMYKPFSSSLKALRKTIYFICLFWIHSFGKKDHQLTFLYSRSSLRIWIEWQQSPSCYSSIS